MPTLSPVSKVASPSMIPVRTASLLIQPARLAGDTIVASLVGEIDLNNSPELRMALFDLLLRYRPRRVVLNLAAVPYMDSSALAVLVEMLRRLGRGPGKVILTSLQPRVRGLLEIARLDTFFSLASDEQEAMK